MSRSEKHWRGLARLASDREEEENMAAPYFFKGASIVLLGSALWDFFTVTARDASEINVAASIPPEGPRVLMKF